MDLLLRYDTTKFNDYILKLKTIASFSRLFSDNDAPYIHFRVAENIYTESLGATNVSRDDSTADAIYNRIGVGIKTFINFDNQKIAEFNALRPLYANLHGIELARTIASYRNNRIDITMRTYGLTRMIYHYTVRDIGKIKIFEEEMNRINLDNIVVTSETDKKISFTDGVERYEFVYSKSTLYKRFSLVNPFIEIDVDIIEDPLDALLNYINYQETTSKKIAYIETLSNKNSLIIPLYTENASGNRKVWEKSGLNQWNAGGRRRHPNEVYINYPAKIRNAKPDFFPSRNVRWNLRLPDGRVLSMKLCQDNSKAIMSDPNQGLGKWILRDVLNLNEGQVLTYDYLLEVGIDSVIFTKESEGNYTVDFMSFEE